MFAKAFLQAVLDTVFPPRCPGCGRLEEGTSHGDAPRRQGALPVTGFCRRCVLELLPITSPICPRCGIPFISREGPDHYCAKCLTETVHYRKARAYGVYSGALMKAIQGFKYGKKAGFSRPLGRMLQDGFRRYWRPGEIDLLLAVPLHDGRLRERGFNQAYLLARQWARKWDIRLDAAAMVRHRVTKPQTGLTLPARRRNVRGAFRVNHPASVTGRRVLLVDDVLTTGATVNECARVLMKARAECVDVLTLARVL